MFSSFSTNLRKRLEDSLDAVEHLAAAQINNNNRSSLEQQPASAKASPRTPSASLNDGTKRQPARPQGRTMTLEDRLKAKFAVGEASGSSTATATRPSSPAAPARASTSEDNDKPTSPDPCSIPLPPSPQLLPAAEIVSPPPPREEPADSPVQLISSPSVKPAPDALPSTPSNPVVSLDDPPPPVPPDTKPKATESTPAVSDARASPRLATPLLYVSDRRGSVDSGRGTPPLDRIEQMDIDELRKRLKVVEQRFSGDRASVVKFVRLLIVMAIGQMCQNLSSACRQKRSLLNRF